MKWFQLALVLSDRIGAPGPFLAYSNSAQELEVGWGELFLLIIFVKTS